MARQSKDERLADVHALAIKRFDAIQIALRDEREQCLQDRRFYSVPGAMWEGMFDADEEISHPRFEINKVAAAVMRKISDYRNNRIDVDFTSKDGATDDELAQTCNGLFRADAMDSQAEEAYDNAFEEAVGGGFGAWRMVADYENDLDPDDTAQRICFEPIFEADSLVWFDLSAKRQDKSDAQFCFVLTEMTREAYKEEWDDDPDTWQREVTEAFFDWSKPDLVIVAEYYIVETIRDTLQTWTDTAGATETHYASEMKDDNPDDGELPMAERMAALGFTMTAERKIKRRQVHKYFLSGGRVLEDCGIIAGDYIPIIPVYGKRSFVDGVERCQGAVRLIKDVQRLKNMLASRLAELSAMSGVKKPIFPAEMLAGFESKWAEMNVRDFSWMPIRPLRDKDGNIIASGPTAYTEVPEIPPALAGLMQMVEADIQDLQGNPQNAEKVVSNISAEAMRIGQTALDAGTYLYLSNFAKALRWSGKVWLSMAKVLYTEAGRKMKSINGSGTPSTVELKQPYADDNDNMKNDLTAADFDVAVSIGPLSRTQKQAAQATYSTMITALGNADPTLTKVLAFKALQNMEGDTDKDFQDFLHTQLLQAGAAKPTAEEQAAMQAQQGGPPDAQTQLLQAAATQAEAEALKARSDVVKTLASADNLQAQTLQILQTMDQDKLELALKVLQQMEAQKVPVPALAQQG